MKENNKAIALAMAAVLSWSTVATAFKIALSHLTHFEMLLVASVTSLLIFAVMLTIQGKWKEVKALSGKMWGYPSQMRLHPYPIVYPAAY